jgi:anti-sigma B factor antagonist
MKIETRTVDGVAVMHLDGRLVRGVGDEELRTRLDDVFAEGHRKIVLDLSDVPLIDSSGIGELVAGKRVADELGARIKLVRLENRVEKTLRLSLILPLFETYPTVDEAMTSFES